jgi:predicted AAA+ superfamily ATPase
MTTRKRVSKKLVLKSILDSVLLKDLKEFIHQEQIVDFIKLVKYISNSVGSKFSYEKLANEV